jgi:hypothetical protein
MDCSVHIPDHQIGIPRIPPSDDQPADRWSPLNRPRGERSRSARGASGPAVFSGAPRGIRTPDGCLEGRLALRAELSFPSASRIGAGTYRPSMSVSVRCQPPRLSLSLSLSGSRRRGCDRLGSVDIAWAQIVTDGITGAGVIVAGLAARLAARASNRANELSRRALDTSRDVAAIETDRRRGERAPRLTEPGSPSEARVSRSLRSRYGWTAPSKSVTCV